MRQVGRMEGLIKNLVMIARSQEKSRDELTAVELSRPVRETAESFLAVAASEGKTLSVQAEEEMTVLGEESSIRQLVSLLTDNAVKYCDANGQIRTVLKRRGRHAELQIFNTYADGSRVDTSRFFERFYREDSSHNEKGGYGIGLSVAESLVKQMKGTIDAAWKDGEIVFTCQFPLMREGNRAGRRA